MATKKARMLLLKIVAEGLIITLSVLFALYVDEWRNERSDRKREIEYLRSLTENLKKDTAIFSVVARELREFQQDYNLILNFSKNNSERNLSALLNGLSRTTQASLTNTTFELLKANSSLSLIRNDTILNEIIQYYGETVVFDNCNLEMMRTFQRHMDLMATAGFAIADSINAQRMLERVQSNDIQGLTRLRSLYCDVFTSELTYRRHQAIEMMQTISRHIRANTE